MRKTKRKVVFDSFFLDPDAKYKKKDDPKDYYHADAFMHGIDAPATANLLDAQNNPITPIGFVNYAERYVALYQIDGPKGLLCIGIEVKERPMSLFPDPIVTGPELAKLLHYNQVQLTENGDIFHVVTKK